MSSIARTLAKIRREYPASQREAAIQLSKSGNGFRTPVDKIRQMNTERLAKIVSAGLVRLSVQFDELKPFFVELKRRFRHKPRGGTILGYETWEKFCAGELGKTRRAIDYFLAGGNPASKRRPDAPIEPAHVVGAVNLRVQTRTIKIKSVVYVRPPVEMPTRREEEHAALKAAAIPITKTFEIAVSEGSVNHYTDFLENQTDADLAEFLAELGKLVEGYKARRVLTVTEASKGHGKE